MSRSLHTIQMRAIADWHKNKIEDFARYSDRHILTNTYATWESAKIIQKHTHYSLDMFISDIDILYKGMVDAILSEPKWSRYYSQEFSNLKLVLYTDYENVTEITLSVVDHGLIYQRKN